MQEYQEGSIITINIGEHSIDLPPMPPKKDFLFYKEKKADQYWRRQTDLPKIFYDWHDEPTPEGLGVELDAKQTRYNDGGQLIALSKEDTSLLFDTMAENGKEGLQEREYKRRTQGVWFFNNGEPTYLTNHHYAILQHLPMLGCDNSTEPGSNYGQYYQFQRDGLYYYEICKTVPYARGGLYVKGKKTGMTQVFSLVATNEAMTMREKNIRMMSITETLCRESNFGFVKYALQKVPPILMPSRSKQNEGEVIFGPPNASRNPLKKGRKIHMEYLNTWLCTVPTTRTSFDTFTNYLALIDEFPKIRENTWPAELFLATMPTVMEGFRRKGTIFAFSYVPEITDRSFYEARQLYKDSKLKTRKRDEEGEAYGETKSKLICHTLTVQEGMFNCCDKYGKPIESKIWEEIRREIDDVKHDPIKLQATKRQYPTCEQDPWQEGNMSDTLFDNLRLSNKMQELEELMSLNASPYKDFNLEFEKKPVKDPKSELYKFEGNIRIKWVTDDEKMNGAEHGRFKWYHPDWTPGWFLAKHINKVIRDPKTGMLKPNPDAPFFISIDPTKYRISKNTGKTSSNALQVFILPNVEVNAEVGKNVTNRRLMISYLYRCDKPSDTLEDMIKLILLFGCMVQIESNVSTWVSRLIEMGLGNFLLMVNKDGALEPYNQFAEQNYFTSQKAQIDMYVDSGQEFLGEPLAPGEIDNIEYLDDLDVVQQLMMIRKENTTEYDAAVAYLEGLMGIDAFLGWQRTHAKTNSGVSEEYRQFALSALR